MWATGNNDVVYIQDTNWYWFYLLLHCKTCFTDFKQENTMTREEFEQELRYLEAYMDMYKHPVLRQVERFEKEMWRDRFRCKNLPKIKVI